jgi:hypothetical protein
MPDLQFIWTLRYHGWAFCSVMDDDASAEVVVSYVTDGPEQLLRAVARVVLYEIDTQAEFEAEPTVYRWFFHRHGNTVAIRLVQAVNSKTPEHAGNLIWHSRQPTTTLARTVIRAFDTVAADLGEANYQPSGVDPSPDTNSKPSERRGAQPPSPHRDLPTAEVATAWPPAIRPRHHSQRTLIAARRVPIDGRRCELSATPVCSAADSRDRGVVDGPTRRNDRSTVDDHEPGPPYDESRAGAGTARTCRDFPHRRTQVSSPASNEDIESASAAEARGLRPRRRREGTQHLRRRQATG